MILTMFTVFLSAGFIALAIINQREDKNIIISLSIILIITNIFMDCAIMTSMKDGFSKKYFTFVLIALAFLILGLVIIKVSWL